MKDWDKYLKLFLLSLAILVLFEGSSILPDQLYCSSFGFQLRAWICHNRTQFITERPRPTTECPKGQTCKLSKKHWRDVCTPIETTDQTTTETQDTTTSYEVNKHFYIFFLKYFKEHLVEHFNIF